MDKFDFSNYIVLNEIDIAQTKEELYEISCEEFEYDFEVFLNEQELEEEKEKLDSKLYISPDDSEDDIKFKLELENDDYTEKSYEEALVQGIKEFSFKSDKDINYDYIEKVKGRAGTLSEIVNILDSVNTYIDEAMNNLEVKLFVYIYNEFCSILEIINEKRNDDYYEIYKAKDTLKKIEEAIKQDQNLNENNFDEFYDSIKSEDWYSEELDKMKTFLDCVDILRIELLYMINLLDKSEKYKLNRKQSRYRNKGFKKNSSLYFKYLREGKDLNTIAKLCDIQLDSLKKFFRRKIKEYNNCKNKHELLFNWTISEEELEYFIKIYIK